MNYEQNYKKIQKQLRQELDYQRYEHTLGVAYTAAALAMRYGEDTDCALLAGLLHDCAKCIPNKRKLQLCEKYHITITEFEQRNPFLLHAKLGSFLAMKQYGVTDRAVISAILYHTTGRPDMTLLEKIIFIADYIEPHRKKGAHLTEIRALAFQDIDQALIAILGDTLAYLRESRDEIDSMTQKTYEYYTRKEQ